MFHSARLFVLRSLGVWDTVLDPHSQTTGIVGSMQTPLEQMKHQLDLQERAKQAGHLAIPPPVKPTQSIRLAATWLWIATRRWRKIQNAMGNGC